MPKAGGTYVFLREAYGPNAGPFDVVLVRVANAGAGAAIGGLGIDWFRKICGIFVPVYAAADEGDFRGLVVFIVILLYRKIATIGKISVLLWIGVVGTMLWLIWGGATHFSAKIAFDFPPARSTFVVWFAGWGRRWSARFYSYWGYYNICHLGSEIKDPERNIPRGIFLSCWDRRAVSGDADKPLGSSAVA